ncbi:putative ribonuclease H-like domain-containing protein [Tanacetum coccineum]
MSNHDDDASDINNDNAQPQQEQYIQPQIITTLSNNNAKFPYLKKDEYEVWAMKMEYWITNNDMNIWKVIQNGNNLKRTGRDRDGRVIILPPTTADEHIAVQRESKARTTLLQSIPDDHVADFHYMDDARDIWNAVKARFGGNAESKKIRKSMLKQEFSEFRISKSEGLHKGYDRMQKILSQLNQLKAKPDDEDINLKFLRGLPSSWSQVALTLKTKGGLELLSFDDLYYKLKTLEIDIKGYSTHSSSQSPSHSAFVSTTSTSKKMSYAESPSFSSSTTYSAPSSSKARSHSSGNVLQDVLHSLVAEIRVNKFKKKAGRKIEFDKKEAARFNKKAVRCYKCLQKGHFARECRAKGGNEKRYSSFKIQELGKKEADTKALITVDTLENWKEHESGDDEGFAPKEYGMVAGCGAACEKGVAEVYSLITGNSTDAAAGEFALMGMTFEVQAYKNSLKTLEKQKRVYQQNQLGYEEKIRVLSIELENTTNLLKHSERINVEAEIAKKDLQTKLDNHLAKTEKWTSSSKNLFRTKVGLGFNNYIGENELGWDDSAFSVFTTNSEEVEGRPLFNRFAKADSMKVVPPPLSGDYTPLSDHIDLDESQMSYGTKSSTSGDSNSVSNDFVSCDNSDKSSEVNTNDFASSDSSVKSSEPKSNDSYLPVHQTSGHFRKNNSSASKSCFVCGSYLHLIKDCNYYETQYANDFDGVGYPQREPIWDNALRSLSQKPVYMVGPVSTSKQNRHPSVHAGNSSSVTFGWWQSTARPMTHLPTPTSSYFQTSIPFGPHVYYNQIHYDRDGWGNTVKSSAGCSWKVNLHTDAGDEGIVDSGCSRSMTGNKERLDDFQPFKGGKVTFGGGEGRITGKGTIRTPKLDFENVYYVKELQQFNLFSVSQICDKKNRVLFTDTDCLVLSNDFKLLDESMVLLRVPRKHNLYTFNLNNLAPKENLACLVAKASSDECKSGMKDGFIVLLGFLSRGVLDETYPILKDFISLVENQLNKKRDYSNARTPQQNGVAERKNRTLIEAARTMLADSKLPTMFWTKAEKANIQGIGHEWSFDLDYLTDSLGYNRDKANQSAGTQDVSSNPAGFQDDDSDSDSDEQVILVPSYPSNNIPRAESKDTSDAHSDEQVILKRAMCKTVPPGSIPILLGSIHFLCDTMVSLSEVSVPTGGVPVPSGSPTDSFFDIEPTTRFSSPSDLGNNVPTPGIFSSTFYDDEFGADLNILGNDSAYLFDAFCVTGG